MKRGWGRYMRGMRELHTSGGPMLGITLACLAIVMAVAALMKNLPMMACVFGLFLILSGLAYADAGSVIEPEPMELEADYDALAASKRHARDHDRRKAKTIGTHREGQEL